MRRGFVLSMLAGAGAAVTAGWWRFRTAATAPRAYEDVVRWGIPGGEGRFIAVGPGPSPDELRGLGERLRREFRRMDSAVVMVFDDPEAARQVRRGSRIIGEEPFQAALRHQRAMYLKSRAKGEESFTIYDRYPSTQEVIPY